MARFNCRDCGQDGEFEYRPGIRDCPHCGARDVQTSVSIVEMPADDPLWQQLRKRPDGPTNTDQSRRTSNQKARYFLSAKARGPIPVAYPFVRVALIQASLDPAAHAIEYIPMATIRNTKVDLDATVITRNDGRFVLDVVEARPLRDINTKSLVLLALKNLDLRPITLSTSDIRTEPRFSNCRMVWSCRAHRVDVGLRIRILQTVAADGPMCLADLLAAVPSFHDPCPAILALACANLLELDLVDEPLGPETRVRRRSAEGRYS